MHYIGNFNRSNRNKIKKKNPVHKGWGGDTLFLEMDLTMNLWIIDLIIALPLLLLSPYYYQSLI